MNIRILFFVNERYVQSYILKKYLAHEQTQKHKKKKISAIAVIKL